MLTQKDQRKCKDEKEPRPVSKVNVRQLFEKQSERFPRRRSKTASGAVVEKTEGLACLATLPKPLLLFQVGYLYYYLKLKGGVNIYRSISKQLSFFI